MSSPAADTSQPTMSLPPSPHAHHSDSTLPSSHSRVGGWHDEDLIDHHLEFHDVLRNQQPKQAVIHNQESVESVAFDRRIPFPGLGTSHDGDMDDSTTGGQSSLTQLNATKPPLPFPNPTPPALTSTSTSSSHPSTPTHSHSLPINMDQPPISVDTVDTVDIETQPDELMCRICFGSSSREEVEELGRLISPCLCSGSMSHVHVKCINQWRGTGRNKKAFHECTQCHFRYRFHRTLIFGLASSPVILLTTSLLLFLLLTLFSGELLLDLLSSRWFDDYIRSPFTRIEDRLEHDTTTGLAGYGFSGGMVDIVVKAVNVFMSGEAEEVVMQGVKKVVDVTTPSVPINSPLFVDTWLKHIARLPHPHIPSFIEPMIQPLLTRFSLGFSLIGALSFVSLLISSSLLGPFQMMNNIRIGRGGGMFGWTRRRRNGDGVGVGSVVVVVAVCMGAIRAIKQLYALTTDISHYVLLKAETAILEVNPKGELLTIQSILNPGNEVNGVDDIADGINDEFGVSDD